MSLCAAADELRPPKMSSRVAEVHVPRTTSVSSGWTACPSQSPRSTEARVPVPKTDRIVGSALAPAVERRGLLQPQGPANDRGWPFDQAHQLLLAGVHIDVILGAV